MDNVPDLYEQPRKKRGRPPGSRKTVTKVEQKRSGRHALPQDVPATYASRASEPAPAPVASLSEEQLAYSLEEEQLSPFSSLLRTVIRRDRAEITRVARELEVAENTIYRWMNGSSEPRAIHLKRLPDVLPEYRGSLIYAINQTFGLMLEVPSPSLHEVGKDIYYRVLELVAGSDEDDTRSWQVTQAIFEYALQHLDAERRGLAITFAKAATPLIDGIHSLRETAMRGHDPWPSSIESKAYLGSTTLAGTAAMLQRMQIWNDTDSNTRLQVEIDDYERSACAVPVMRGSRIAGVLIASSTQPNFFDDPAASQAVQEFALLLGIGLVEKEFHQVSLLHLRPMPGLRWQREQIARSYIHRILTYARKHETSRSDAERHVQHEMELEFEDMARIEMEQRRAKIEQESRVITPGQS